MTEEVGELAGAIVRHQERRDGRQWMPEIEQELGQVLVCLDVLADKLGLSIEHVLQIARNELLSRTWNNLNKE